jgi:deferrochelatase/peroxidase EfeB
MAMPDDRQPAQPPGAKLGRRAFLGGLAALGAAALAVTVSVGESLFDDRFDPARTHGDLLLSLSADQPDTLLHALRQLMRRTRDNLVLHWMLDGYNRPDAGRSPGRPATATCSASRTARPISTSATSG